MRRRALRSARLVGWLFTLRVALVLGLGGCAIQGSFLTSSVVSDATSGPIDTHVARIDDDSHLDLVVANQVTGTISWFGQTDSRAFLGPFPVGNLAWVLAVSAGDVNLDGKNDVLALASAPTNQLVFFQNDGTGKAFGEAVVMATGPDPSALLMGDLTNDGTPDICWSSYTDGCVYVQFGQSPFSVAAKLALALDGRTVSTGIRAMTLARMDADSSLDLVVSAETSHLVIVFTNTNDGAEDGWRAAQTLNVTSPGALATGDLNADGGTDLIVTSRSACDLTIFATNASDGGRLSFLRRLGRSWAARSDGCAYPPLPVLADVDADLDLDILALVNGGETQLVWWGGGAGRAGQFYPGLTVNMTGQRGAHAVRALDLYGDGSVCFAITFAASQSVAVVAPLAGSWHPPPPRPPPPPSTLPPAVLLPPPSPPPPPPPPPQQLAMRIAAQRAVGVDFRSPLTIALLAGAGGVGFLVAVAACAIGYCRRVAARKIGPFSDAETTDLDSRLDSRLSIT